MHHHSTKQRLAALRRRLGIQLTPPKWARERSRKFKEAAVALRAARDEAARQIVAALTPAPIAEATPAGMFAMASGPTQPGEAPTTIAEGSAAAISSVAPKRFARLATHESGSPRGPVAAGDQGERRR